MKTSRLGMSVVVLGASLLVGASQVSAAPTAQSAPSSVTCISPGLGATGPTGARGDTGANGVAPPGPRRVAHMVSGELAPFCNTIPGVCNYPQPGDQGAQGATGATGLSSVPDGAPRRVHVSGGGLEAFCAGIPRECWYASQGAQGPTGPTGETGLPYDPSNGPGRRAHVVPAQSFEFSERVLLEDCELPTTGGGSTNMLPFALALLGVGAVALFTGRRRQRVAG